MDYTEKYANGIFLVLENKVAKRNCEYLQIDFGENTDPNELKQKVTKLEKTGILSIRLLGQHFQYILKEYADKNEVEQLIKEVPPQSREALRAAYNIIKMNNVEALNFLGSALDNRN